ncbi:SIR2 family protein [Albibacterium bauzanense]|nr:SIR2 family protein [Albibacterium bauzanense]
MENLKEILATPKQIGLLLGAGVSKACGLPNIEDITKLAIAGITNANFIKILDDKDTVENILNKTQQLRILLKSGKEINSLKEQDILDIEKAIKKIIFDELSIEIDTDNFYKLVLWLNFINRDYEKEIFTLNYDLLVEKALEKASLPYFSGFIGNVKPFFITDSVDDFQGVYVKQSWVKLWKLHGSLNFVKDISDKIYIDNSGIESAENLLIYPSMDKYLSSRKAPYISYLDRLRKYLIDKEKIVFVLGYSFGDDHINEVIVNGLNNNHRLSVIAFAYDDFTFKQGIGLLGSYPNFSIYTNKKKYSNRRESIFNSTSNIGDFNNLISLIDEITFSKPIAPEPKIIPKP